LTTKWTYSKVTQLALCLNLNNGYLRISFNLLCRCFSFNFGYISNCDFSFKKPLTKGNINFFSYVVTLCQTVTFIFTSNQVFVFTTPFVSIIYLLSIGLSWTHIITSSQLALIAQLVENCTIYAEFKVWVSFGPEFSRHFCRYCLASTLNCEDNFH